MNLQNTDGQKSVFETVKHTDSNGREFWFAREFQSILGYVKWDKFLPVIEKAKQACINSQHNIQDHFLQMEKMVAIGSGAQRTVEDYQLSRYELKR